MPRGRGSVPVVLDEWTMKRKRKVHPKRDTQESLQRKLKLLAEMKKLWEEFFKRFDRAMKMGEEWGEDGSFSEEEELEFLKIKARLCWVDRMLGKLMEDQYGVSKDVLKTLRNSVMLEFIRNEDPTILIDTRGMWHEVFIEVTKMIGNVRTQLQRLEAA